MVCHLGVEPTIGVFTPQIIPFNRVFHDFHHPILVYPYFWKHPFRVMVWKMHHFHGKNPEKFLLRFGRFRWFTSFFWKTLGCPHVPDLLLDRAESYWPCYCNLVGMRHQRKEDHAQPFVWMNFQGNDSSWCDFFQKGWLSRNIFWVKLICFKEIRVGDILIC